MIPHELHIRVSMVHMKNPPQSTVVPYPVQIFGTLQWKNRPVIFATIIQVCTLNEPPLSVNRNDYNNLGNLIFFLKKHKVIYVFFCVVHRC